KPGPPLSSVRSPFGVSSYDITVEAARFPLPGEPCQFAAI
ncbi:2-amino-4-hydroxy-6-hydroxymethyldihydropteridine diphosphokinase, partial [Arthrobacter stackebrandtii]